MRKALLLRMVFLLAFGPLIGIIGCGEELGGETATIVETDPGNGDRMFAEENLIIRFDKPVASVKVNGVAANVDNTHAYWPVTGLDIGKQDLTIEWTDGNGGVAGVRSGSR